MIVLLIFTDMVNIYCIKQTNPDLFLVEIKGLVSKRFTCHAS